MERRKEEAEFGTPERSHKGNNKSGLVRQLFVKTVCEEFTITKEDGYKRQSINSLVVNDTGTHLLVV